MFVGEQPGDREDREGKPFVGPAGRIFDQALEEAGIDRALVYVTNTVKHFHYAERGKRRIHQRPRAEHIKACRPWLDAELDGGQAARARVPRRGAGAGARRPPRQGHAGPREAARVRPRAES